MMRIITGKARGTKLETLEGEKTRPTAERTKEAIFSSLHSAVVGAEVLDLYAGSGQLALEALSRGAKHAVACDSAKAATKIIQANARKTHLADACEIFCMEDAALLRSMQGKRRFDLVFLDPPYALGLLPNALKMLREYGLLNEDARIVCESAREEDVFGGDVTSAEGYETLRTSRYGAAFVTVLTPKKNDKKEEMDA
jgi:16S rRNA (guanine(966)-N(2))-methyltransferase RsmD